MLESWPGSHADGRNRAITAAIVYGQRPRDESCLELIEEEINFTGA
jgi:hypothetical protein